MSTVADQIVIMDTGSTDGQKKSQPAIRMRSTISRGRMISPLPGNAVCQKAVSDYWMWMDADDVMEPEQAARFKEIEGNPGPLWMWVMMKYLTGFDENGRTSFPITGSVS